MDYRKLIPEIRDWEEHNRCAFDPEQWIRAVGNYEHAIGYAWLFWPSFEVFDGCVLRRGFSTDAYYGFLKQTNGNRAAVEAVINHVDIFYLFRGSDVQSTREQLVWLGDRLRDMWECKLRRDFPERRLVVAFNGQDEVSDDQDFQLTAYQAIEGR
jgi:hypothetical protein